MGELEVLPTKVIIGPHTLILRCAKSALQHLQGAREATGYYGAESIAEGMIAIDTGLHYDKEAVTIMHECLHAILDIYRLDRFIREEKAEELLSLIAPMLISLLRDNPDLVAYWQKGERKGSLPHG